MKAEYTANPQYAGIAGTTITPTTAATAVTLASITAGPWRQVYFTNSCDKPVIVTLNNGNGAGNVNFIELPALYSVVMNLGAADIRMGVNAFAFCAYAVSAPAAGRLAVTVV